MTVQLPLLRSSSARVGAPRPASNFKGGLKFVYDRRPGKTTLFPEKVGRVKIKTAVNIGAHFIALYATSPRLVAHSTVKR